MTGQHKYNARKKEHYHTGYDDGFEPLHSLDLNQVSDFDELAEEMKATAFGGRSLGEAVDVLYEMVKDPEVFVVGTFAGAMTPAKMGLLIVEMIERGMLNAVVSTGALMTHGMVEGFGMQHFKYRFGQMNDEELYAKGYDRIYDVLELEKNLDDLELLIDRVLQEFEPGSKVSSRSLNEAVGKFLKENLKPQEKAILKSAYERSVPVYIPAFSDSEYGLDFALYNRKLKEAGKEPLRFDPMEDLEHLTTLIEQAKSRGIFTIGGGVPRNWAQQIPPYIDLIKYRIKTQGTVKNIGKDVPGNANTVSIKYKFGVRICPEPVHWGGLSGCTYSEGMSWGKFHTPQEGGKFAEVLADATIAWPIILKAVIQRLEKDKK